MTSQDYPPNNGQSAEDQEAADQALRDEIENFQPGDAAMTPDDSPEGDGAEQPPQVDVSELNDKILRLAAELENTRRRAQREKLEAGRYAITAFARDLIGVADNFERALAMVDTAGDNDKSEMIDGVVAGLKMTEKELLGALERHGVKRVFPVGEKFDPNLHQAVAKVPSGTIPQGHVVDIAQPGFLISDRVLRAAMVTVSNGQPVQEAPGHEDTGSQVDEEA